MENNHYSTLSTAYKALQERGFSKDFEASDGNTLKVSKTDNSFKPNEVEICEFHRFEGESNPSDTSIIYAMEAKDGSKGILIDAYGADASMKVAEFLKQVKIKD